MTPPPSSRPASDSLPPEPEGSAVADLLAWLKASVKTLDRRSKAHALRDEDVYERVAEMERSLGSEGSPKKGIPPTGLHLAVEHGFETLHGEIVALAHQLGELASTLTADRTARVEALKIENARAETLAAVRAPWQASAVTARNAAIGSLVALIFAAAGAFVALHWR